MQKVYTVYPTEILFGENTQAELGKKLRNGAEAVYLSYMAVEV